MHDPDDHSQTTDAARARLERADGLDDERRLETLEVLYAELEAELERDVESFPGPASE